MDRLSLIERKDLHNIARDFDIDCSTKRHKDDAISVKLWVTEMQNYGEESPVLYYKGQNELESGLDATDFVLIIMTSFQSKQLIKFGYDKICIDGTHGTNAYDIQLYTLMIIDEFQAGCPVAFCFSNRSDETIFRLFFNKIKFKVGGIKTKVFMTDDFPGFYNAWAAVMGEVPNRLLCTWHVDKNWRKNLVKIKGGAEKQALVYKSLRVLLEITLNEEFENGLNELLNSLLCDKDTYEFGKYFEKHYYNRPECWAYCYRIGLGINTNMYLEAFHKVLKHIYLEGKQVKRLDKSINAVMKLARDSFFKRLIKLAKNHSSDKTQDVHRSHKASVTIELRDVETVEEQKTWIVPSKSNSVQKYLVSWVQNTCECVCLKCCYCNICIHTFKCSCTDNVIKMNICKHIHFCARTFFTRTDTDTINNKNLDNTNDELVDLLPLKPIKNHENIDDYRRVMNKMELMMSLCKKSSITDQNVESIEKKIDKIIDELNQANEADFKPTSYVNVKKNVPQQTRSFYKKKSFHKRDTKNDGKEKVRYDENNEPDENNIANGNEIKVQFYSTKRKSIKKTDMKKPSITEANVIKAGLQSGENNIPNIHSGFDHSYNYVP